MGTGGQSSASPRGGRRYPANAAIIAIAAIAPTAPICAIRCAPPTPKLADPERNSTALSSSSATHDGCRNRRASRASTVLTVLFPPDPRHHPPSSGRAMATCRVPALTTARTTAFTSAAQVRWFTNTAQNHPARTASSASCRWAAITPAWRHPPPIPKADNVERHRGRALQQRLGVDRRREPLRQGTAPLRHLADPVCAIHFQSHPDLQRPKPARQLRTEIGWIAIRLSPPENKAAKDLAVEFWGSKLLLAPLKRDIGVAIWLHACEIIQHVGSCKSLQTYVI